jgi:cytochrome bd-type quinol oxidase subunit 1
MFTQGQYFFAGFFVVAFFILIVFSYRKDLKLHKKYYKGSLYVLAGFLLFIGLLFVIKKFLH